MMRALLRRLKRDETGGTATEYAMLAAMLAIGVLAAVAAIGVETENSFNSVANAFGNATSPTP